MSQSYGPADEAESIATIHRVREVGVNFLDPVVAAPPRRSPEPTRVHAGTVHAGTVRGQQVAGAYRQARL